MTPIDFIHERSEFAPLWTRAKKSLDLLRTMPLEDLLFFDSIDLQTQKFFELIRHLLAFKGSSDFATLVMKPDPFNYFHFHFGKYPGFIQRANHTDEEFFEFLLKDPGGSLADALGVNSEHYVVMPLPGDWIAFGDRSWGTGVLYGPPDIMECARSFYPFFHSPPERFRVEP
ncbi:hypothetical protein LFL96_27910 [Paraburkholderia sp. D15]|uniref:hypothetical protein n=1 Tax=Paraburkholderia sp. D15 TaxID=2880218 RepID=UPI0024793685|nr:hypothetical protein [Paraburkholderia sp. D15]WGS52034.1 hypothetical protein LFL96_27910 [Paraburkholderia sp. D15]